MTINQHGLGTAVAKALTGTAVSVRWAPSLQLQIDSVPITEVLSVEVRPAGYLGTGSVQSLTMTFQGSNNSPRNAVVTREISAVAIAPTGDGFTATLAALA